ncbi:hypothetical protein AVDCRST_MAG94-4572 [uncultured Leptolyngbya sp.]|uniref:Uncharacterized protein n=1 Tax=uncultured Leptolyngbya sp. TaxID=332963 RepID=A0A6J4N6N1_9CYAN|nr:hypothetical protein AVDCRST_MAG94-4572 [uncultured Leptolyngbya sp.]
MVEFFRDAQKVSLFFTGIAGFSFLSFLGRVLPDLSGGVFVMFSLSHALVLLVAIIFGVTAWTQRSPETDPQDAIASAVIVGLVVAIGLLFMVWMGSGIGYWVGG